MGYFVSATHRTKLIQLKFMWYVTATKSSSPHQGSSREGTTIAGHGSQQRIDAKCRRVPCSAVSIGFHRPETPWIPFEVYIT